MGKIRNAIAKIVMPGFAALLLAGLVPTAVSAEEPVHTTKATVYKSFEEYESKTDLEDYVLLKWKITVTTPSEADWNDLSYIDLIDDPGITQDHYLVRKVELGDGTRLYSDTGYNRGQTSNTGTFTDTGKNYFDTLPAGFDATQYPFDVNDGCLKLRLKKDNLEAGKEYTFVVYTRVTDGFILSKRSYKNDVQVLTAFQDTSKVEEDNYFAESGVLKKCGKTGEQTDQAGVAEYTVTFNLGEFAKDARKQGRTIYPNEKIVFDDELKGGYLEYVPDSAVLSCDMFQSEQYMIPYSEFTGDLQVSIDGNHIKFTYTMTADVLMNLYDQTTGTFQYHGAQFDPILKVYYHAKLTDEEAEALARSTEKYNMYSNEVKVYYNGVIAGQATNEVVLTANSDVKEAYEVTYRVVNGTWSDNSTEDRKETVQTGSRPASVPVGMKASSGYTGGAWDTDPADATITGDKTFTYAFTARQAATVEKAPTAKTLTYSGSAQELVTEGEASGGTMQYALGTNETTAPTDGWSADVPKGTDAKTYYVWYKAKGNDSHSDSTPKCVPVKITSDSQPTPTPDPTPDPDPTPSSDPDPTPSGSETPGDTGTTGTDPQPETPAETRTETTTDESGNVTTTTTETKVEGDTTTVKETETVTDASGKSIGTTETETATTTAGDTTTITETKTVMDESGTVVSKTETETVVDASKGTKTETTTTTTSEGTVQAKTVTDTSTGASESVAVISDASGRTTGVSTQNTDSTGWTTTADFQVSGDSIQLNNIETDNPSGEITIPSTIIGADGKTYTVTTIGSGAFSGSDTQKRNAGFPLRNASKKSGRIKLELPATITEIENNAFKGADIKKITLNTERAKDLHLTRKSFSNTNAKIVIHAKNEKQYNKLTQKIQKSGGKGLRMAFKK